MRNRSATCVEQNNSAASNVRVRSATCIDQNNSAASIINQNSKSGSVIRSNLSSNPSNNGNNSSNNISTDNSSNINSTKELSAVVTNEEEKGHVTVVNRDLQKSPTNEISFELVAPSPSRVRESVIVEAASGNRIPFASKQVEAAPDPQLLTVDIDESTPQLDQVDAVTSSSSAEVGSRNEDDIREWMQLELLLSGKSVADIPSTATDEPATAGTLAITSVAVEEDLDDHDDGSEGFNSDDDTFIERLSSH